MMNLQQFVTETLKQVTDGVTEAQKHAGQAGAIVNAYLVKKDTEYGRVPANLWDYPRGDSFPPPTTIEFDVAVTTIDNKDLKAGIGIFVTGLGIGYQAKKETAGSEVSRIKFSIPVVLPSQPRIEKPK